MSEREGEREKMSTHVEEREMNEYVTCLEIFDGESSSMKWQAPLSPIN